MSREIKFRGIKKGTKGGWIYGGYCSSTDEEGLENFIFENSYGANPVYEHTVNQFTGLKDLHGKEIYEGDILRNPEGKKGVVEFFDGSFCLKSNGFYVLNYGFLKNKEVIGNIYENIELLTN